MEPDWIDAKFKVIHPRRRWRITVDWRNFLLLAGVAIALGARALLGA